MARGAFLHASITSRAEYAANVKQRYSEEWLLGEEQLGLTLGYTYSFSRTSRA